MTENKILQNAFKHLKQSKNILISPGHDCAAIRIKNNSILIATCDQLIESVHYLPRTNPAKIAKKLLSRNLSDIAAAGGAKKLFALSTIAISEKKTYTKWFDDFFKSLGAEAKKWNVSVCGGDIAKIAKDGKTVLTLSLIGESSAKKLCSRSGALPDDILFCTGEFGNSFNSKHHIEFTPRLHEAEFLSGKFTNTMIDVSDGLLIDASRVADKSGIGIVLNTKKIPLRKGATLESALGEGEDYELLFSVSEDKSETLLKNWPFKTKLTAIGKFAKIAKGKIISEDKKNLFDIFKNGYDHFQK